jgi:hypothetical protein
VKRLLPALGIAVGFALGLAGFALGSVGLMAMGTTTPKLIVFLGGALLLAVAVALMARSVLAIRASRGRTSA